MSETALRELLDQRVAVLDGAWGTMLQGAKLTPEDYVGDRFGDHTHEVTGDPDLLNLTSPPRTPSPRPASARPTTRSRTTCAR